MTDNDRHRIWMTTAGANGPVIWEKTFLARRYSRPLYLIRNTMRWYDWEDIDELLPDHQFKYVYYHNLDSGLRKCYLLKPRLHSIMLLSQFYP